MSEHSDDQGSPFEHDSHEHEADDPLGPTFSHDHDPLTSSHGESEHHGGHESEELESESDRPLHQDPPAHEPPPADDGAADHVADGAAHELGQLSPHVQGALASPGGTVFDFAPDSGQHWFGDEDPGLASADRIVGEHYVGAWAADDGTGMIGALLGEQDVSSGEAAVPPGGQAAPTVANHLIDLVYDGSGGIEKTATQLWQEFGPGGPPPTDQAGQPMPATDVLAELAHHLEDPVARSVVHAALDHARGEQPAPEGRRGTN
jgi:hypothetical protein